MHMFQPFWASQALRHGACHGYHPVPQALLPGTLSAVEDPPARRGIFGPRQAVLGHQSLPKLLRSTEASPKLGDTASPSDGASMMH